MGKDHPETGSADHWTITPKRIEALEAEAEKSGASSPRRRALADASTPQARAPRHSSRALRQGAARSQAEGRTRIHRPRRPARLSTATKFINQPDEDRVEVQQAGTDFEVSANTTRRQLHRPAARPSAPSARHVRAAGPPNDFHTPAARPTDL